MLLLMMFAAVQAAAPTTLTIVDVAAEESPSASHQVRITGGDLDGDGAPDDAVLAFDCHGDMVMNARYVLAPRDVATGAASGKVAAKQKMWLPANFRLQQIKPTYDIKKVEGTGARTAGYDLKKMKGNEKRMAGDDWTPITLGATDGLCPATADAAATIVKSKSNITNN